MYCIPKYVLLVAMCRDHCSVCKKVSNNLNHSNKDLLKDIVIGMLPLKKKTLYYPQIITLIEI